MYTSEDINTTWTLRELVRSLTRSQQNHNQFHPSYQEGVITKLQGASVVVNPRAVAAASQSPRLAGEKVGKGFPELDIECCVDEGVYSGGSIAQPEGHVSWNRTAIIESLITNQGTQQTRK